MLAQNTSITGMVISLRAMAGMVWGEGTKMFIGLYASPIVFNGISNSSSNLSSNSNLMKKKPNVYWRSQRPNPSVKFVSNQGRGKFFIRSGHGHAHTQLFHQNPQRSNANIEMNLNFNPTEIRRANTHNTNNIQAWVI